MAKKKLNWWQKLVQKHHKKGMTLGQAIKSARASPEYKRQTKAVKYLAKERKKYVPRPRPKKARKVKRKMAKRRRRNSAMTIPLAPVAGLIAGVGGPIQSLIAGDTDRAIMLLVSNYTGYDTSTGVWNPQAMRQGVLPLVIGLLVHKFVGGAPLNLNRILARAKVPFIRI